MRISASSLAVPAILLATLVMFPAGLRAQEADDSRGSSLMVAVQQVIALQEAWMNQHQSYGTTYDLADQLDGRVLDDDIFPDSGGVIRQLMATDGQAYILLARDLSNWEYITAASSGKLIQGRSGNAYQSALAAVGALVWAENALFAREGSYGWISDLQDAGLIGDHWATYMDVSAGEVVLLDSGAVLTLTAYDTHPLYEVVAELGTGSIWTASYLQSYEQTELSTDYEALRLEKARNSLRTVISANAAFYASYGYYGTLPMMEEHRFLGPEFGVTEPADLRNGIRALVVVQEDGQAYHAVTAAGGVMYYGNETGEIREYPVDDLSDNPEIEALRQQLESLME